MKPNPNLAPTQVDRPATSEEIRTAISLSSLEPDSYAVEDAWEIAADLGGFVRIRSFDVEASRLIEELLGEQDPQPN